MPMIKIIYKSDYISCEGFTFLITKIHAMIRVILYIHITVIPISSLDHYNYCFRCITTPF